MMNQKCLTSETKTAFLSGELPVNMRETVEAHLASCRACRHQLAILFEESKQTNEPLSAPDLLKKRAKQIPEQTAVEKQNFFNAFFAFFQQPLTITVSVASLLLISLATFFVLREQSPTSQNSQREKFRQGSDATNRLELLSPTANAQITTEQIEFRWSRFPNAKSYTLYVLDEKGDTITELNTEKESLSPGISTIGLTKGKYYFWFVKAKLADGITKDSDTLKFTLVK